MAFLVKYTLINGDSFLLTAVQLVLAQWKAYLI